jgi:hypothetical protein
MVSCTLSSFRPEVDAISSIWRRSGRMSFVRAFVFFSFCLQLNRITFSLAIAIVEDARHPTKYRMLLSMVDVVFADEVSLVDRRINDTYPGISSNPFVQEGGPSLLDHRRSGSRHAQTSYCIACTNARRSPGDRSPLSRPESPSHPLALMYGSYNGVRSTSTLPSILPYRSRLPWTFNDNGDLVHLQPHPLDQHRFVDSQCFDQITGDD